MTIPLRFNRLMLFRPQQYHDAGAGFGDELRNGRLVYLNFYNNLDVKRIWEQQAAATDPKRAISSTRFYALSRLPSPTQ
jgi:hypothetical protein